MITGTSDSAERSKLGGGDIRGLTAVISVKLPDPQFEDKARNGSSYMRTLTNKIVTFRVLSEYLEEHQGKEILKSISGKGMIFFTP